MNPLIQIPPYLIPLMDLFAAEGERAYPVGGCVRDTLLGVPPHDWDMAVTTPPEMTQTICRRAGYHVIPTGLKHGTVTILVPVSGDPQDRDGDYAPVECTTCRTEGGYADGRHPDAVAFTGRIEDDLSRRDFTVNAMAFMRNEQADEMTILDLFGGREDLAAGVIRCVGDPETRFSEDALRILRAVRFAVKLGFAIEPATLRAVRTKVPTLTRISRERIGEEFEKILCSPTPARGMDLLCETDLISHVLPHGYAPYHPEDLDSLPAAFPLRMAYLQWGLPASDIESNLTGLRLSNITRREILALAAAKDLLLEPTPYGARQWRHETDTLALPSLTVRRARADTALRECSPSDGSPSECSLSECSLSECSPSDCSRPACAETERERIDRMIELVDRSIDRAEPVDLSDLTIGGSDLIALGAKPGPALQVLLRTLLTYVWEDPAHNTQDCLTEKARCILASADTR